MSRRLLALLMMLAPGIVLAANYNLSATWTDPTPAAANYAPVYDAETRVASGAAVQNLGLTTTSLAKTIAANPGDKIEVRVRARNTVGPIDGPWTIWYSATAPAAPVTPLTPTGVVITITVQ